VSGDTAIAVDFSRASGADTLVVMVGVKELPNRGIARATTLAADGTVYRVLTLAPGDHPQPKVDGNRVVIGRQTVAWDGTKLVLGTMAGAPRLNQ
jgi:hypothetical protein